MGKKQYDSKTILIDYAILYGEIEKIIEKYDLSQVPLYLKILIGCIMALFLLIMIKIIVDN